MVNYICVHKGVHLKSKLQQTGTWPAAAWLQRHLCYRPAVFFRRLALIMLSVPQRKFRTAFKSYCFRYALFWGIRQRRVVILYRRFGTTHPLGLFDPSRMGRIRCPETSVNDYHSTLRNTPEERKSHLHRGGEAWNQECCYFISFLKWSSVLNCTDLSLVSRAVSAYM
jgi:hypothetical protein